MAECAFDSARDDADGAHGAVANANELVGLCWALRACPEADTTGGRWRQAAASASRAARLAWPRADDAQAAATAGLDAWYASTLAVVCDGCCDVELHAWVRRFVAAVNADATAAVAAPPPPPACPWGCPSAAKLARAEASGRRLEPPTPAK
jgi:hypothetical protein